MSTYAFLLAKLLPLCPCRPFLGHKMFICYHQENSMTSKMLLVYREKDLKFKPFSHRNPVAWEGDPNPLPRASLWVGHSSLASLRSCRVWYAQTPGGGAVCPVSQVHLVVVAFLESTLQGRGSAEYTSGNVILYDLCACFHFLKPILNAACDSFRFRWQVDENEKTRVKMKVAFPRKKPAHTSGKRQAFSACWTLTIVAADFYSHL